VRIEITDSPERFDERAGELLAARLEHNVLATAVMSVRAAPQDHPGALFAWVEDGGSVVAAALRTPPRRMVATVMDDAIAEPLLTRWLSVDRELPGVNAPQPVAASLAAAWERLTGGRATPAIGEALHELERLIAPARPASGRLRVAAANEQDLLVRWTIAFLEEAGIDDVGDPGPIVARSIRRGGSFVWDDGGPVSMLGLNPAVAGVVRVGPVYTPPEHRNRGYASSAVAAASELALTNGARRCMLFADVTNATSNHIYQALGYERRGDWQEFDFGA
jgi:predicted GNAT family acetyltransferase